MLHSVPNTMQHAARPDERSFLGVVPSPNWNKLYWEMGYEPDVSPLIWSIFSADFKTGPLIVLTAILFFHRGSF